MLLLTTLAYDSTFLFIRFSKNSNPLWIVVLMFCMSLFNASMSLSFELILSKDMSDDVTFSSGNDFVMTHLGHIHSPISATVLCFIDFENPAHVACHVLPQSSVLQVSQVESK